jgi:tungstate transport system ATP-binding protein
MFAYQLKQLEFYYGSKRALLIPQLSVKADAITTLIGANGSGKTTLLHLLAFLHSPDRGEVILLENEGRVKKDNIALLPQKPYLFQGRVEDNLLLALKFKGIPRRQRKSRIDQMLSLLDIAYLRHQSAKSLSGGEMQKVALAQAIITLPGILLMDEPFSYLDQESGRWLEQFMRDYQQEHKAAVVFSTHDRLQGTALADDVISLVSGKPVNSPLINVYHGVQEKQCFNTGKQMIYLADNAPSGRHISIAPTDIILSKRALVSSMRNQFSGRVTAINEESGNIRVTVIAGEPFQAIITHNALQELALTIGDEVWVSFKSNRVQVF